MTDEPRKRSLIALLERGRQEEHAAWDRFTSAEKAAKGTSEDWSLKDLAAHVSAWKDRDASRLDSASQGQVPLEPTDFDTANAEIFKAHWNRSWAEVMDLEALAFEHLVTSVEALSEAELLDAGSYEWTQGRTLAWIAAFTGYYHPQDHISDHLAKRGELDAAEAMQIRIVEAMGSFDSSPRSHGTNLYNLACFYALNGMPELALENLSRAFTLRPELVDWSKRDSDLDSLRGLPAYQVLSQAPPSNSG
jgi:tetratricopeptide (TPR) repeat protein